MRSAAASRWSHVVWLPLVGVLLVVRPAHAQLGTENALLAKLVALQLNEVADVAAILGNAKIMLEGVNETAAGIRQTYQIYQMLRHYSIDDLVRDAKAGLMEAFPDLRAIITETKYLQDNIEAGERGTFFTHWDPHDPQMRPLLDASFRLAYRGTIWRTVFQDAFDENATHNRVDDAIINHFKRAKSDVRVILQDTALAALMQKAASLTQDAEEKKRADLQAMALTAELTAQNVNNTTRMRDLAEVEAAGREEALQERQRSNDEALKEMDEHVGDLFSIGSIQ